MTGTNLPALVDLRRELEAEPWERLGRLLPQANDGDPAALAALRAALDGAPGLWRRIGDLAGVAEASLIDKATGGNSVVGEAIERELGAVRRALLGPAPTPLERLLVDRVALCWLYLAYVEGIYHQAERPTWEAEERHGRRIDRAQKRYLAAVKALATVRKLAVPALQVNIADKQVNVARSG